MSQENVELVRGGFDSFARGDLELFLEFTDPQVEIVEPFELPGQRTYRGHQGLLEAIQSWAGQWEDFRAEPERIIDAGDRVVVVVHQSGRGKTSGATVEQRIAYVFTIRDGKLSRWEVFLRVDEALEAVGLSELAMSQENVEIVRRIYEGTSARLEGPRELFGPEYEADASDVAPDIGVLKGFEAVQEAFRPYWETFNGFHVEIEEVVHADENRVITRVRDGGRMKGSDSEVWNRFFHVWTFADSKVARLSIHSDRKRALEAVGLAERDAHAGS